MASYEMLKLSVWKTEDLTRCMEIRKCRFECEVAEPNGDPQQNPCSFDKHYAVENFQS